MASVTLPWPAELKAFTAACCTVLVGSCSVQNVAAPEEELAAVPLLDDEQASTVSASPAASIVPRACLLEIVSFIAHLSTRPAPAVWRSGNRRSQPLRSRGGLAVATLRGMISAKQEVRPAYLRKTFEHLRAAQPVILTR